MLEFFLLFVKLVDCCSDDVDCIELFIVEGDSVLGIVKLVWFLDF